MLFDVRKTLLDGIRVYDLGFMAELKYERLSMRSYLYVGILDHVYIYSWGIGFSHMPGWMRRIQRLTFF